MEDVSDDDSLLAFQGVVLSSRDLNTIVDDDVRRPRLPGAGQKAIGVKIHFAGLLEMAPSAC